MIYNLAAYSHFVLYGLLLAGLFLLVGGWIRALAESIAISMRVRRIKRGVEESYSIRLNNHLTLLLKTVFKQPATSNRVFAFKLISLGFAGAALMLLRGSSPVFALAVTLIMGSVPYLFLRLRLQQLRLSSSYEGDTLVAELVSQYKLNYYNVEEAVEKAALNLEEDMKSRRAMLILAKGIKSYQTDQELQQHLREFEYTIDTTWAGILTTILSTALESGINVNLALQNLLSSIEKAKKVKEYERRENIDASAIIKFLIPIGYVFMVYCVAREYSMSLGRYFEYQFLDPFGMRFFIIMLLSYTASLGLYFFYQKQKMDF